MKQNLNEVQRLQKIAGIIKEVGEATAKAYTYNLFGDYGDTRIYGFETDSNLLYTVEIEEFIIDDKTRISIKFHIPSEEDPDIEDYAATPNKGELYRVMATITNIIKKELEENPEIFQISFKPEKRKKDTNTNIGRLNLYKRYFEKQFPGVEFKEEDGEIVVNLIRSSN